MKILEKKREKVPFPLKISPDQYKGIEVGVSGDDQKAFTEAVIREAASDIDMLIPEPMVEQKLNALLAEEMMEIGQDPIYNLLADMVGILKKAYKATGISRPISQVRSEAMDIMLQTMSKDRRKPSKEHLYFLLKERVKGYRDLSDDFHEKLDKILEERKKSVSEMTAEERVQEVFGAYLGSLDISQEAWLEENQERAVLHAKFDLLLDAVIDNEDIVISAVEMEEALIEIGQECHIDVEEVKESIDVELLEWQLKRNKAKALILDSVKNNVA